MYDDYDGFDLARGIVFALGLEALVILACVVLWRIT
jgi:hypothetical protein